MTKQEIEFLEKTKDEVYADKRAAKALHLARPDLQSVDLVGKKLFIKATLDESLSRYLDAVRRFSERPEFRIIVSWESQELVLSEDVQMRVRSDRPRNKKELEGDLKRIVRLAINRYASIYGYDIVTNVDRVNQMLTKFSNQLARLLLDSRIEPGMFKLVRENGKQHIACETVIQVKDKNGKWRALDG